MKNPVVDIKKSTKGHFFFYMWEVGGGGTLMAKYFKVIGSCTKQRGVRTLLKTTNFLHSLKATVEILFNL